jgi:hypothetical protein
MGKVYFLSKPNHTITYLDILDIGLRTSIRTGKNRTDSGNSKLWFKAVNHENIVSPFDVDPAATVCGEQ